MQFGIFFLPKSQLQHRTSGTKEQIQNLEQFYHVLNAFKINSDCGKLFLNMQMTFEQIYFNIGFPFKFRIGWIIHHYIGLKATPELLYSTIS